MHRNQTWTKATSFCSDCPYNHLNPCNLWWLCASALMLTRHCLQGHCHLSGTSQACLKETFKSAFFLHSCTLLAWAVCSLFCSPGPIPKLIQLQPCFSYPLKCAWGLHSSAVKPSTNMREEDGAYSGSCRLGSYLSTDEPEEFLLQGSIVLGPRLPFVQEQWKVVLWQRLTKCSMKATVGSDRISSHPPFLQCLSSKGAETLLT